MTDRLTPQRDKRLRDSLATLPELGALAATALPGEKLGGSPGSRTVPGSRPPLTLAAVALTARRHPHADPIAAARRAKTPIVWIDAAGRAHPDDGLALGILDTLAGWTRHAESELLDDGLIEPDTLAPTPTVDTECAWLLRHIVAILERQWVSELADDVDALVRDCRAVLRERPEYRPSCTHCGQQLTEHGGYWECQACGRTMRDARMTYREAIVQQRPMTVAELVKAFGFRLSTVESWVQRGRLAPADPDASPRRYHAIDALRLADDGGATAAP